MIIYIRNEPNPKTGKGLFASRLVGAIQKQGETVCCSYSGEHDVSLHLVKIREVTNSVRVVRLNGVYHNTDQNLVAMNNNIRNGIQSANAIVYQSKFSKFMNDKYVCREDLPSKIIYNGADTDYYKSVHPIDFDNKFNFFAFARWRQQKRLPAIVESFRCADIPDSCLHIGGDLAQAGISLKQLESDSRIKYHGVMSQTDISRFLVSCDAVLHLSWVDWCPNSVIESLCAGCPVITNNVGGTHEIVSAAGGLVCDIDAPYNGDPIKLYSPPKFDVQIIAEAMKKVIAGEVNIDNCCFDIKRIAKQYIEFFSSLVKEKCGK
jgi:glycosyltransferase involved in cell wall biosynthesis